MIKDPLYLGTHFTKEEVTLICNMIEQGITQPRIAQIFGISVDKFKEQLYCNQALRKSKEFSYANRNMKLAESMWRRAQAGIAEGKNQAIAIFMAKVHLGWKETFHVEHSASEKSEAQIMEELKSAREIEERTVSSYYH